MKRIPNCSELRNLKVLHLNNNKIDSMVNSETLSDVEELDLRSNQIASLEGFANMNLLRWISLSSNWLKSVQGFPLMPHVRYVGLFANFIENDLEMVLIEVCAKAPMATNALLMGNNCVNVNNSKELFTKYHVSNTSFSPQVEFK